MSPKQTSLLFQVPTYGVSRSELRDFAGQLAREVAGGRPFDCLITTDRELRRLNLEFRNQNRATDVLSFPAAGGNSFLGDIAISYDRANPKPGDSALQVHQEIRIFIFLG